MRNHIHCTATKTLTAQIEWRWLIALVIGGVVFSIGGKVQAADWVDHRAFGPFVCRSDFSLSGHEKVFADLADIQRDLYQRLGIPPSGEQIEIYLFRGRSEYNRYLQHWYPDVPSRRALFIKNNGHSSHKSFTNFK